ncbi:MAG: type I DNA topoisomerase [Alistipes sp.]|nr:type I DNA topoisomerase [Candidatus Minthomonas equi]
MGEQRNLVIVESPHKAETIGKFLGKGYVVKSSRGHIRDLSKKQLGIDVGNGFIPEYVVPDTQKRNVAALKAEASKSDIVYLASDEDREGEAIAWHLAQTLNLNPETTRRIGFHEITKKAIVEALENPREVNMNLVMAQQARRVLDRLVGFELSPILWRKVKPSLSAGRVQSAVLKLVVDKEREIMNFKSKEYWKVDAIFRPDGKDSSVKVAASVNERLDNEEEALKLLQETCGADFRIASVEKKKVSRTPASPFTTSLLQQEAARKCGFSVSQTMSIAQKLYEAGLITYMRTDSTNLSTLALATAKECILKLYGEKYHKARQYKTKSKGAQEAHEAIRPTYLSNASIQGTAQEKKLYELIWKRTIASQMSDARLEKTDIIIDSPAVSHKFHAEGSQVLFDGFLKVYLESGDDDKDDEISNILPVMNEGMVMKTVSISASQKFTVHPLRYTQASLVKKMEELGIGRPSTYASTISTLFQREYIVKADRQGEEKQLAVYKMAGGKISKTVKKEMVGAEKGKLCPENIGILVTDFLGEQFPSILDSGFTARVEEDFDDVAAGKKVWNSVISDFYGPFHKRVNETIGQSAPKSVEKVLGTDPVTGKTVLARIGKFGPLVQIGESDDPQKKFASQGKGQLIETLTLEEALKLFQLPRTLGEIEGETVVCSKGRFGPYIKYRNAYISLPKGADPMSFSLDAAAALIRANAERESRKNIKEFPERDIQVLNGKFGPYIKCGGENYKIPKGTDAASLSLEECLEIIERKSAKK